MADRKMDSPIEEPEATPTELSEADRRWRRQVLPLVQRVASYMAVELEGTLFFFKTSDAKTARSFILQPNLRKDHVTVRRAVGALEASGHDPRRGIFVDVGAHIGTTTLYAIRHLGFAGAVALEPSTENFRLLRINIVANGLDAVVQAVQAAASSQSGLAALEVGSSYSGCHRLVGSSYVGIKEQVEVTTLDALVDSGVIDPGQVGLLWLDVEGHEVSVIEGASTLLLEGVPVVMEICREKLTRSATFEHAIDVLRSTHSHVLDLGKKLSDRPGFRSLDELTQIADEYAGHCTDLLVLPQSSGSITRPRLREIARSDQTR